MSPTIVLISGASRGLGRGLASVYLSRPDHIVIAATRNPSDSSSKPLADLPQGKDTKLIVVKIDSKSESDAAAAVKEIEAQGIDHLDIVIANAGIATVFPTVAELKISDFEEHIKVNVYGVVLLYQATVPLLRKSANPKWATMGSSAGWLEFRNQHPVPNAVYAPSKAAVHWITKRINAEEEKIAAWVQEPGWVQTEGGNSSAQAFGLPEAPVLLDDSIKGMISVLDAATKESHGGKMWGYDGKQQAW
ncbi:Short-chain dehydrogenase reductase SDR protein [Rutstroemia sp. NJR-2017a BBW]|nr:Short-chain dehydrogenase reductase SDR protein [Rutstroemia sp. NJR-2017a BBW]